MTVASLSAPAAGSRASYIGALLTAALMAALIAALVIVLITRAELAVALADVSLDPSRAAAHAPLLAILIGVPLLCAVISALAMWRAIWVVRVTRYMRFLHAYSEDRLRRDAPLRSLGIGLTAHSLDEIDGKPGAQSRPALELLTQAPHTLLLGAVGAGKTTTLLTIAHAMSARSAWARLAFGVRHEPLPTLVSLPGLARTLADAEPTRAPSAVHYIATLVARMGTDGLGGRVEKLLKAGRITLLCDDYARLDDDERGLINQAIQALSDGPYRKCQIVVACESATYADVLDDLGSLARFQVIELDPVPVAELLRLLQKRQSGGRRSRGKRTAGPSLNDVRQRPVGVSLGVAAIAAALTESAATGDEGAWGRAALLQSVLLAASGSAAPRDLADAIDEAARDASQQPALVWAALAASLQDAASDYMPLDPTRTAGECVYEWLTNHPPPGPTDFALSVTPELNIERIERDIQAGLRVGMLQRSLDGLTLGFAHTFAQVSAAAWWLEQRDDGLGRLNSQLLRPQWTLPVAFWAGAHAEPADLAQRIFRFANSPDSVAPRAGIPDRLDIYPHALALALAASLEGTAPQLARMIAFQETRTHAFILAQQSLRDLLDTCVVYGANPDNRLRLARALSGVQTEVGAEFAAYLSALAREPAIDRMLRAQLTTTLGLTATPEAIEQLVSLLMQSDPTMRQAVEQALIYAGARAIPALQAVVRSGDAQTRHRAEESLRLLSGIAPAAGEAANDAAIAGLNSPDASQRRVAVTTLSAIGASQALNELIARLDDVNGEVRLAAAAALGQLGGKRALLALRRRANSDDARLRLAVAQALGIDPVPASTQALLRLLKDPDARVRAAAATSLGAIADKRAIGPLREAAEDADPWVRHAAQTAVRRYSHG